MAVNDNYNSMNTKQTNSDMLETFVDLAGLNDGDDLAVYMPQSGNEEMRGALAELLADSRKTTIKEAAIHVLKYLKSTDSVVKDKVSDLRAIRRREKALKDQLAEIELAKAYGEATMNWLPLMVAIDPSNVRDLDESKRSYLKIPDDFKTAYANKKALAAAQVAQNT